MEPNQRTLEFRSYVPNYPNRATIHEPLQIALGEQYKFEKKTSAWDIPDLSNEVGAPDINLDLNCIDRVYHLNYQEDTSYGYSLETCVRQDIAGQKVFIEMFASYNENDNDEFQGDGEMYVTMHPTFFLNNSHCSQEHKEHIRNALESDGYRVSPEETHEYMQGYPSYGNAVPHLQFLTHTAIYNNRDKLEHFRQSLPRSLSSSVDGFIQVKNEKI